MLTPPYPHPLPFTATAIGVLPLSSTLSYVASIAVKLGDEPAKELLGAVLSIDAGLPPVPHKLVARIQAGEFVDMAELLPKNLGVNAAPLETGDKEEKRKGKREQVKNILKWLQCYRMYIDVVVVKYPQRLPDMLGYQVLIIAAHMKYEGDGWLGYDHRFRQRAAAMPDAVWARIEPTLWNIAFAGKARAACCKDCFSLTHPTEDYEWAPQKAANFHTQPTNTIPATLSPPVCRRLSVTSGITTHPRCAHTQSANSAISACTVLRSPRCVVDKRYKAMHYQDRPHTPLAQASGAHPSRSTTYQRYRTY